MTDINLWIPERDPHTLATLGKLGEELSEAAARVSRCIIQGLDELDPETGRPNRIELERELADVEACIAQAAKRLHVYPPGPRIDEKYAGFDRWHDLITEELKP